MPHPPTAQLVIIIFLNTHLCEFNFFSKPVVYTPVSKVVLTHLHYKLHFHCVHTRVCANWKERNALFNDTLNTFYLQLYGVRHMVKDHSDSERGNLLLPYGLLFPISSKHSFICIIPQTG